MRDTDTADPAVRVELAEEPDLGAEEYLRLATRVWPGRYSAELSQEALAATINVTARLDGRLIGSVRILTDGYFFGVVPDILVDPDFQGLGIGRRLMERAWSLSPTSLFLGALPGNEGFFEKLGYERSLVSFARRKPRPAGPG